MYLIDKVTVFRVHHRNSADLLAGFEGLDQIRVSKHEQVTVRHEHLETVDAVILRQRLHVLSDLQKRPQAPMNNESSAASFSTARNV